METQRPDAAKPRDIIEFLREEQRRRQSETPKPRWLVELLEEANKPFSEEKKAQLDEEGASGCDETALRHRTRQSSASSRMLTSEEASPRRPLSRLFRCQMRDGAVSCGRRSARV